MTHGDTNPDEQEERERVVIRDNRKIDPKTGQARRRTDETAGEAAGTAHDATPAAGGPGGEYAGGHDAEPVVEPGEGPTVAAALLDERTADLQRLQAEYANYRRRAERDRLAAGDVALGRALGEFLPVLDDLERAAAHGDLETGPLKAIADKLQAVFDKLGLEPFGAAGDPFDPSLHEAVMHEESDEVTVPTCTTVMRRGYRFRERLLRAAMVAVTDPAAAAEPVEPATANGTSAAAHDDAPAAPGEANTPAE